MQLLNLRYTIETFAEWASHLPLLFRARHRIYAHTQALEPAPQVLEVCRAIKAFAAILKV
jgi:hypothetical protein